MNIPNPTNRWRMNEMLATACLAIGLTIGLTARADSSLPRLESQGTAKRLIVDGKPFLILGGELGNSTGEPDYLRQFWPKFKALNLNSIVAPSYWDVIESSEGKFDFATVDGLIRDARAQNMKLVLLWFGTWKNSMSCYAPVWVKTNVTRFHRSQDRSGRAMEILSPFSDANLQADIRAFRALMKHLREVDGRDHTVVMVQVENEIGMIPDALDHSAVATEKFRSAVPTELLQSLQRAGDALMPELRAVWAANGFKTNGTWVEIFGADAAAEEIFMAWHFARYVQAVTVAGKAEYPLPIFANAALIRPGYRPGQYPSAGPLPHLFDVWRAGAPAIDFFAPDIYFQNFAEWAGKYTSGGNPLFIPEALRNNEASVNAFYAFGQCDAMGFCPFGIESISETAERLLTESFGMLKQLSPLISENVGRGTMAGLLPPAPEQKQPHQIRLGDYVLNVTYERTMPPSLADGAIVPDSATARAGMLPPGGLVIALGTDEYLFAGMGFIVTFDSTKTDERVGILNVQEGRFVDGQWKPTRWLNGDQTHQGRHLRLEPGRFDIQRIKLYRY